MSISRRLGPRGGTTTFPVIPSGWEQRVPFRIYRQPDVLPLIENLAENPTRRTTTYANAEMYCLTQDFRAAYLTDVANAITNGRALEPLMYVFPAARVGVYSDPEAYLSSSGGSAFTFSKWVDRTYWARLAEIWEELLIPLCHADDPRIGLSTENYGIGTAEPTVTSLTGAGYTVAQFYAAIDPFVDMLRRTGRVVCVGPIAGEIVDQFNLWIPRLVSVLGADKVQAMWEIGGGYGQHDNYRTEPKTEYFNDVREIACGCALYDAEFGAGTIHRISASDDMVRAWGELANTWALPGGSMGAYAPWLEYFTKTDTIEGGTDAYYSGTTLHTSNDVKFDWTWGPMSAADMPYSVGSGTSTQIKCLRSTVQTGSSVGTGSVAHHVGSKLEPQGSDIYAAFREDCLPTAVGTTRNWTVFARFQIPSTLAADRALVANADFNIGVWQVYYDNAADAIKIEFSNGAVTTLLSSPSRDTTLKFLVSREGNTTWHVTMDGTLIDITLGVTASDYRFITMGGGQEVATFPTNNKLESCRHFVGVGLRVWWRTLTAAESLRQFTHSYPHGRVG